MNLRSCILILISVTGTAASLSTSATEPHNLPTAKVLVWVRDGRGAPVTDLTADDFEVTENAVSDRVLGVERFFPGTQTQSLSGASRALSPKSSTGQNADNSVSALTHILVLLAPMPAGARRRAIADALHFFSQPQAGDWDIALVDDEGRFLRFSRDMDQARATLRRLEKHCAPYAKRSAWSAVVQSAVRELGVLPGRHVVILISDRDGVPSSTLIGLAVSNQAAMYAIESQGPATVVPFGGAAESQNDEAGPIPFATGEFAAESLSSSLSIMGYTDTGLWQFVQGAEETGGLSVNSVKDAFKHISSDAGGYYLVSFEARPQGSDGTLNAFSIAVKKPHMNVRGPRYYMTPLDAASAQMPADMKAALQSVQNHNDINVVANSWLFPDQGGVHWGVYAADLKWLDGEPPTGSRVKIYAELTNESMHGLSGAWFEEKAWPPQAAVLHWQREGRVYPGSYMLRVTAMDTTSGKIAFGTRIFTARPLDVPAFRFSGIVLADGCMPPSGQATARQNLFDPLLLEGCKLAPAASARFRSDQNLRILVRMYPPSEKISQHVLALWKTFAVVDDKLDKATELTLTAAEVRGLSASGTLPLNRLNLAPGKHRLSVLFVAPGHISKTQEIPLGTEFSIER